MSSLPRPVLVPVPVPAIGRGALFFVVGSSGVGKSSLLAWVRSHLPADADTVFARRTITRGATPGESHESIERHRFVETSAAGDFSLEWEANGLWYGVREKIEVDLHAGRNVIVDGSREYVPTLLQRFPQAQVVWITAPDDTVRGRLESRRREAGAALLRRLERARQFPQLEGPAILAIDNRGPIDVAGAALLALITRGHRPASG